tara:strand:- start:667 stop:855 length:189 start_codon:yes stop_codon:yes gene_type:complete
MTSEKYKIGDSVTAKTTNLDGDTIFINGKISSLNGDVVFITKKFPRIEHFQVKIEDIIIRGE